MSKTKSKQKKDPPDQLRIAIGLELKRLRTAKGFLRRKLAAAMDVSEITISGREKARVSVSSEDLMRYEQVFGVRPGSIMATVAKQLKESGKAANGNE